MISFFDLQNFFAAPFFSTKASVGVGMLLIPFKDATTQFQFLITI